MASHDMIPSFQGEKGIDGICITAIVLYKKLFELKQKCTFLLQ